MAGNPSLACTVAVAAALLAASPDFAQQQVSDAPAPTPVQVPEPGAGAVECPPAAGPASDPARPPEAPRVWGVADFRGIYAGTRVAPNGVSFDPVFSLGLDFNLWLWRSQGMYLFTDSRFWGQETGANVTDSVVDFSKRELDQNLGAAWNYAGPWEARFFAYSLNNLNRGYSSAYPDGFKDGIGIENRFYLGPAYADLGTDRFDVARANFVGVGYYPSKSLVGNAGDEFKPSAFAEAYLTRDLWSRQ